ncbi:zinc finger protein [Macleaya cordata]|uniref:Zinc finger protein n=1 Tax=Macleaya cordata TaxID=56857 RepID=A0A200QUX8_MACCD|nr:zinc finger protein [Macleaya cordata]
MERICEFCCETRPIVYCQADSARLCLSCDSRVHSANALSKKHFRALLCEACGTNPASVNCLDHPLFMCRNCDCNLHDETTVLHQKRVMTGYLGCPSARDFAVLWGYDLNELKNNNFSQDLIFKNSSSSMVTNMKNLDVSREFQPWVDESSSTSKISSTTSIFCAESELGSSNFNSKMSSKNQLPQDSRFVLQQILNLERLQHAERNDHFSRPSGQVRTAIYSGRNNISGAPGENLGHNLPHLQGFGVDLQQAGSMNHEIHGHYFPFSQLEHLNTASGGLPFHGDPFWQSKSPAHSSQLWSQSMQDLGICKEIDSCPSDDGLSIPDVDLTFRNYEDLFGGGDQEQTRFLFDEMGVACSSTEKDVSLDKSDNGYPRTDEVKSSSSTLA